MFIASQLRHLLPPLPNATDVSSTGDTLLTAVRTFNEHQLDVIKVASVGNYVDDPKGNLKPKGYVESAYDAVTSLFSSANTNNETSKVLSAVNVSEGKFKSFCGSSTTQSAPVLLPRFGASWPILTELQQQEPRRIKRQHRATAYRLNKTFSTPLRYTIRHLLRTAYEATVGRRAEESDYGYSDWWFNSPE